MMTSVTKVCAFAAAALVIAACGGGSGGGSKTVLPSPLPTSAVIAAVTPPPVSGDAQDLGNGLKYIDIAAGSGGMPVDGHKIKIEFALYASAGRVGGTNPGEPLETVFTKGSLIPGMVQGIATMHVGGQRRLIIPPELAFGAKGVSNAGALLTLVRPNETITVDVTLVAVE